MAEKKLTPQQRMRQTVRGARLKKLMEEQNIRSDSPRGKLVQEAISLAIPGGLITKGIRGGVAGFKSLRAAIKAAKASKAPKMGAKMGPKVKATSTPKNKPTKDSVASEFWEKEKARVAPKSTVNKINKKIAAKNRRDAKKKAADEAAKKKMTSTSGVSRAAGAAAGIAGLTAAALSDKAKDMSEFRPPRKPETSPSDSKPTPRKPLPPVEEGKPGMTRKQAEAKGIVEPKGGFWQDVADALAGGKGKGTVEYDYPDDADDLSSWEKRQPYRKGGAVKGFGKALKGTQIKYSSKDSKTVKRSSGGKVGMRGCGKALRGYGKAMKGK